MINRWASDIVRSPPVNLVDLCRAVLTDLAPANTDTPPQYDGSSMQVQALLRHAISETVRLHVQIDSKRILTNPILNQISEGIINCLIVTNSPEANDQLTRIHEHIFARALLSIFFLSAD